MRFAFTEQQLELRAAVRQVLDRQCTVGDLRAIADHRTAGAPSTGAAGSPPPEEPAITRQRSGAPGGPGSTAGAPSTGAAGSPPPEEPAITRQRSGAPGGPGSTAGAPSTGAAGSPPPEEPAITRQRSGAPGGPGRAAERWSVLSELGAPGLLVPEEHGGLGLTEVDLVGVEEEAGWAALPEPLVETAALAAPLLAGAGAAEGTAAGTVAARALPQMATGELVATVGGVDPTAGGLVTTTRPAPAATGGASTQGTVCTERVAGATRAGLYLLAWEVPGSGWQLHAVDAGAAWVTATPSIDGTRDLGTVEWTPWPHTMIASGDQAAALLAALCDRAAVATAAQLLGLADRMITLAADYARERRQFGRPIGSFQAVKHHLAGARVRLEFARPATYRAADSLARSLPERSEHASMAKALASDAADLAARVALQVHGAIGYTWECDLHLFMKRAWALSAAWGDAATHRARVLAAALARTTG